MSRFFDIVSAASIVGIWPRYLEPRLALVSHIQWELPPMHAHLAGRRFVLLSDLHLHPKMSQAFLDKIVRRTLRQKPDAIFFVGDFLCHSRLHNRDKLKQFLCRLQAPYGSYCVLGNHDYNQYVSCDASGIFAIRQPPNPLTALTRGLKTIFSPPVSGYGVDASAQNVPPHQELISLLQETPFTLLENDTVTLPIGLNITGLGEHALGRSRPKTAFSGYKKELPGVVLTHNPDTFSQLFHYPGELILAGHTHGEQIHLPFLRPLSKKLTRLANTKYTRGMYQENGKLLYVTRGLGSPKPFRLFSPPEIVVIEAVA